MTSSFISLLNVCRAFRYLDLGHSVCGNNGFLRRSGAPLSVKVDLFVPGWLISWSADHTGDAAALRPGKDAEDEVHRGEAVPQPGL